MTSGENQRLLLALMSGTSVDTIDAAICRVWQSDDGPRLGCKVLSFYEHPMDAALRTRIFQAFADGPGSLSLACSLNFEIGEAFARAAQSAIDAWDGNTAAIDAIASHGQTLYHIAPHMVTSDTPGLVPSTLQLGDASVIAARTGLPVISNFRVADMALGGNGAPLVPFADYHLFSEPDRRVVVHNLGGIGNCTWLPPTSDPAQVLAFDTGPANMIIDGLVSYFYPGETYDQDGRHAAAGMVMTSLLNQWMSDPYITAPPPKSTGRERYGIQFIGRAISENPGAAADNLLATATEFTAMSLAENLRRYVMPRGKIDRLLLAGGGTRNSYLFSRIRDLLAAEIPCVQSLDDLGHTVTSKSRECAGFAMMGYAHLLQMPCSLPSVTGARRPAILGQYTPVP